MPIKPGSALIAPRSIIPLWFDRKNPEDPFPLAYEWQDGYRLTLDRALGEMDEWDWFSDWYIVEGDIPFQMCAFRGRSSGINLTGMIDWAERTAECGPARCGRPMSRLKRRIR